MIKIQTIRAHLRRPWPWLVLVTLAGFALRAYRLGYRPLWDDEAFSVLVASNDFRHITLTAVTDTYPPLHLYLTAAMIWLGGVGEFACRFASFAAGVLAVPVAYVLGRRWGGRPAGLATAAVVAVSPFALYFSQEARPYSWLALTAALSMWAFTGMEYREAGSEDRVSTRFSIPHTPYPVLIYALASAAMLYSHYLGVWVLVVQAAWLMGRLILVREGRGPALRRWLTANAVILVLFLPWFIVMLTSRTAATSGVRDMVHLRAGGPFAPLVWIWQEGRATHDALSMGDVLRQGAVSFSVGDFVPDPPAWWLSWGFLALAAVGAVAVLRPADLTPQPPSLKRKGEWHSLPSFSGKGVGGLGPLLLLWAIGPVLLSYVVAFPLGRPNWAKYFIVSLPAFQLLVGLGIAWLWTRAGRLARPLAAVAAAFVLVASVPGLNNYFHNPRYARSDIRPAVRRLEEASRPGDALLAQAALASPPFWHYYRGSLPHVTPRQVLDDPNLLPELARSYTGLWVVQNLPIGFDPDQNIERWLTMHAYRTVTDWVGDLVFRYYSMPVPDPVLDRELAKPVRFGRWIELTGYRAGVQPAGRESVVQLQLEWKTANDMDADFMVGARAVDATGRVWGQTNSSPLGNFRPTSGWAEREAVRDHLGLLLEPDAAPEGTLHVEVWWFDDADGSLLPCLPADRCTPEGRFDLGEIATGTRP